MNAETYLNSLFGLEGKTILVTGAAGGIGSAISKGLAAAGAEVALCGRTLSKCQALAEEITAGGGKATTATICTPILMNMPGVNLMFAAYAACMGSQMFSPQNDSFFWALTRTFKLDDIRVQMCGFEVVQFAFTWTGLILLCIVNLIL